MTSISTPQCSQQGFSVSINIVFSPRFWSYYIMAWGFCQPPILVVISQREVEVAILDFVQSDNFRKVEVNSFLFNVVLFGILCHLLCGDGMVFVISEVLTILVVNHWVSFLSSKVLVLYHKFGIRQVAICTKVLGRKLLKLSNKSKFRLLRPAAGG
jgi:hypothetical protein